MAVLEMNLPIAESRMEDGEAAKTPHNRLMDMIAGWASFAERDEERGYPDAPGVNDAIYGLYQDAGALGLEENNPVEEEAEETIRAFVVSRVLPLLLQGRK